MSTISSSPRTPQQGSSAQGGGQQQGPTTQELMGMVSQLQESITALEQRNQLLEGRLAVKSVKVRPPEPFDGNRSRLRAFLTQLDLYLNMNKEKLRNEVDKIFFASTYLNGTAFNWFEPYIRDYQEKPVGEQDDDTKRIFASYARFKERLEQTFGDIDAARNAERKLWRLKQTGSASKYASEFLQVISLGFRV
ncbi:protein LDOC1 [Aspergillus awamori]|uniref:Protein LDOC1 n=1 Tax=Aspergillus awamori TaxID=105351 RepID=A0A401KHZ9_ASPAW|nr:protein LDOC1 [Aspergillus awamori]